MKQTSNGEGKVVKRPTDADLLCSHVLIRSQGLGMQPVPE